MLRAHRQNLRRLVSAFPSQTRSKNSGHSLAIPKTHPADAGWGAEMSDHHLESGGISIAEDLAPNARLGQDGEPSSETLPVATGGAFAKPQKGL